MDTKNKVEQKPQTAQDQAATDNQALEDKVKASEETTTDLKTQLANLQAQLKDKQELQTAQDQAATDKQALKDELAKAKLDENKLKESEDKVKALEAELEKANQAKQALEAKLEKAKRELEETTAGLNTQLDQAATDKQALEDKVKALEAELEKANQEELIRLQQEVNEQSNEIRGLEAKLDQANQANGELQTAQDQAATDKQVLEDKVKASEDKVKALEAELEKAKRESEETTTDLNTQLPNLQAQLKDKEGLQTQLDQANQAKQELQTARDKAPTDKQALEEHHKQLYISAVSLLTPPVSSSLSAANAVSDDTFTFVFPISYSKLETGLKADIMAFLNGNQFDLMSVLQVFLNRFPNALPIISNIISRMDDERVLEIQNNIYQMSIDKISYYLDNEDNSAQERYALSEDIFNNIVNFSNTLNTVSQKKFDMLSFFVGNFNNFKFNNLLSFGVEREEYRVATKKLLIEYLGMVESNVVKFNQKAFFPILKSVTKYLNQEEYNEIVLLLKANATNQQKQSDFVIKATTSATSTDDINTGIDLNQENTDVEGATTQSLLDRIMEFQKDYRKNYKSKSPILLTMIVTSMTPLFFSLYILNKRNVIDVTTMGIAMFACAIIAFVAIYSAKKRFSDLKERNNEAFWIKFKLAISMTLSVLSLTVLGLGVNEILATSTSINSPLDFFDFVKRTIPSFFSELAQNKEVLGIAITALVVLLFAVIATSVYTYKLHSFGKREEEKINDKVKRNILESDVKRKSVVGDDNGYDVSNILEESDSEDVNMGGIDDLSDVSSVLQDSEYMGGRDENQKMSMENPLYNRK